MSVRSLMSGVSTALAQHQVEIEANRRAWEDRPLLREVYAGFYRRVIAQMDPSLAGRIVEIGSGVGNLKSHVPRSISTDLFPNPWLDLVCDGYELPFASGSLSHVILFDVFHHLRAPNAFLREARRALQSQGRLLIFDPFISLASWPAYGLLHHEPVAINEPIDDATELPRPRDYYAAQGNATRLFFRDERPGWPDGWDVFHRNAFSAFHYLLSGGFSKPAMYPAQLLGVLRRVDDTLSGRPRLFAARCLVGLKPR